MPLIKLAALGGLLLFIVFCADANAYDLTGVNTTFNFGTVASPFPDLTLLDGNICVGYAVLLEPANYYIRATSSSSSTVFQLIKRGEGLQPNYGIQR